MIPSKSSEKGKLFRFKLRSNNFIFGWLAEIRPGYYVIEDYLDEELVDVPKNEIEIIGVICDRFSNDYPSNKYK